MHTCITVHYSMYVGVCVCVCVCVCVFVCGVCLSVPMSASVCVLKLETSMMYTQVHCNTVTFAPLVPFLRIGTHHNAHTQA